MKVITAALATAATAVSLFTSASPASAQYYYGGYSNRPSYSFTPSYSGIRYDVYRPQRSYNGGYGSSFDQPRRSSNRGFGYSSGSYFGW